MPRKRTNLEIRQAIASCLDQALRDNNWTKVELARRLGVKRQMVYVYLKAKAAPGPEVMRRISKICKLALSNGFVVTPAAFGPEKAPGVEVRQLSLLDALDQIRSGEVQARIIGRRSKFLELRVRIAIAS